MHKAITYDSLVDDLNKPEFDVLIKKLLQNDGGIILKQALFHFFVNEWQLFGRTDKVDDINKIIKNMIDERPSDKNNDENMDISDISDDADKEEQDMKVTMNDVSSPNISLICSFLYEHNASNFEKVNRYIFISCRQHPLSLSNVNYSYKQQEYPTVSSRKCNKYYLNRYKLVKNLSLKFTDNVIKESDDFIAHWFWNNNNLSKLDIDFNGWSDQEHHETILKQWNVDNIPILNNIKEFNLRVITPLRLYWKYITICPKMQYFNFGQIKIDEDDEYSLDEFDKVFSAENIKNNLKNLKGATFAGGNSEDRQLNIYSKILNGVGNQLESISTLFLDCSQLEIDHNVNLNKVKEVNIHSGVFNIDLVQNSNNLERVSIGYINNNEEEYDEILKTIIIRNEKLEYIACCGQNVSFLLIMNCFTKSLNQNQRMYKDLTIRIGRIPLDDINGFISIIPLIKAMDEYTTNDLMFICMLEIYDDQILSIITEELNVLKATYLIRHFMKKGVDDNNENMTEYDFIISNTNCKLCYGVQWKYESMARPGPVAYWDREFQLLQ